MIDARGLSSDNKNKQIAFPPIDPKIVSNININIK